MERLTFIDQHGWYAVDNSGERVRGPHVNRLAALEDILNGYDLDRLNELIEADREGYVHIGRCLECKHYEGLAECEYLGGCGGSDWICGWFEPKKSALKAMKEEENDDRA